VSGEPRCSKHGRLRYLVPVLDAPPDLVSREEAEQFMQFVEQYNQYWSQFFDPIGVRGRYSPTRIELETCILPLVENSVYNGFKAFAGGEPLATVPPTHPCALLRFSSKIDLAQLLSMSRQQTHGILPWLVQRSGMTIEEVVGALGDHLTLGVSDAAVNFALDLSTAGGFLPFMTGGRGGVLDGFFGGFLTSALGMPTYAAIHVRKPALIERFLTTLLSSLALEHAVESQRRGRGTFFQVYSYSTDLADGRGPVHTLNLHLFVLHLRGFVQMQGSYLVVANQRHLLRDLKTDGVARFDGNLEFRFFFENFDRIAETTGLAWQEQIRQACTNNLGSLWALHRYRGVEATSWAEQSLLVNGYRPFCPAGGTYSYDPAAEKVVCSAHGHAHRPRQPARPDPNMPVNAFAASLKTLSSSLSFTEEGIMTKVLLEKTP
jgi:hypothetical protein